MSDEKTGVFDKEASRILLKTQQTRETLLDGYIASGVEKLNADDLDMVTKLLESMDKQIHTNTRIELAKKDSDTSQDYMQLVKTILTAPLTPRGSKPILPKELSNIDVSTDELSFDREEFRIDDFLRTEDD